MALPEGLSALARERVLSAWSGALEGADQGARRGEATFVERADLDAVVVVELEGVLRVSGPARALEVARRAPRETLLDAVALAGLLPGNADPIGTADLLFTDRHPRPGRYLATAAGAADAMAVEDDVSSAEWDESGLNEMDRRWAVAGPDGRPAAIAGFEPWRSDIAQLGVAAASQHRAAGLAYAAAAAATAGALDAGLIAQWRSRQGNDPSLRLARRLGFVQLGVQSAVALND